MFSPVHPLQHKVLVGLHLLHNAGAKELAASHAGREKGLFLLISIGADMASAVSSLLFDPWNPSVSPPRVPSTSPSRKAKQQMLQFHGTCTANPHVPLQPKAQEALYAARQYGLFQQAVQIHGLILSSKKRKTFSWCVLQAEMKGLIFLFFTSQRPLQLWQVLWLHPKCPDSTQGTQKLWLLLNSTELFRDSTNTVL